MTTKGRIDLTDLDDEKLPMPIPADWVPGPKQGHWTYNDYAALDDEKRYEIVNGILFLIPTPWSLHQKAVGGVFHYLFTHIEATHIGHLYIGPLDVELAPDTVLQPDVLLVLNTKLDKLTDTHVIGAPDLVVEVSSPGTIGYERREKQDAYARAGVPEYWIVNPEARVAEVLVLEVGKYHSLGVFRGKATLPSRVVPEFTVPVEQFFL